MKISGSSFFVILLVMALSQTVIAGGRVVTIVDKSGLTFTGELLTVRPSGLVISYVVNVQEEKLKTHPELMKGFAFDDIRVFTAKAESHTGEGFAMGTLAGIGVGVVAAAEIGRNTRDSRDFLGMSQIVNSGTAFIGCMAGGMIVGAVLGSAASHDEIIIGNPAPEDLLKLAPASRFSETEPQWLKSMK
jgi:hypothetical protein